MSIEKPPKRVSVYIDGFNLYHAVAELRDNKLKWLNFQTLARSFLRPGEELQESYFFTAVVTWNREKQARHRNFIKAQKFFDVRVVESKFKKVTKYCEVGERFCKRHEEKQTDVAFATTLMADAIEGKIDRAILVTADTDQIPLVLQMRRLFPQIALTLAPPPGRGEFARELGGVIPDRVPLDLARLLAHKLPREIRNGDKVVAAYPPYYDEPNDVGPMSGANHCDHPDEDLGN